MQKIINVEIDSVAHELGIKAGDFLIGFDGQQYSDFLDLIYYEGQEAFVMSVLCGDEQIDFEIEKDIDEPLGISVNETLDSVKDCSNKCIFCFVDQLPTDKKMRETLHFKDDDWRMSVVFGNYVTLTNLKSEDIERIIRQKISPLFVSVHAVTPKIRAQMISRSEEDADILPVLQKLHEAGINLHCQIVLCSGFNDGEELAKSIKELSKVAKSLAVVPVGLTKYHNPILDPLTKEQATSAIECIEQFQREFYKKRQHRFVYAADEMYVIADRELPDYDAYDDFEQIENGVGMMAKLQYEVDCALLDYDKTQPRFHRRSLNKVSVVTGEAATPFIREQVQRIIKDTAIYAEVFAVSNDFFGQTITVAGLVTGGDIVSQLRGKDLGQKLLVPKNMLREFNDVFLDDMSIEAVQRALQVQIEVIENDGEQLVRAILGEADVS